MYNLFQLLSTFYIIEHNISEKLLKMRFYYFLLLIYLTVLLLIVQNKFRIL